MKGILVGLVALVLVVLAVTVLGHVGPVLAITGLLLAALVVLNPAGVGSRIRQSIAWWSIPGMRRASSRAVPFAALLLAYTVPVPMAAYAIVQAAGHGSTTAPMSGGPLAVGGGLGAATDTPGSATTPPDTAPPPTVPTDAPTPVAAPTPTPPPTAPPTARPTPRPTPAPTAPPETPPPARDLCGAPPNPWGYNFCGGGTINSPPGNFCDYFNCISSFADQSNGYVVECRDATYSHSGGRKGSCSKQHRGEWRPLNP